MSGMFMILLPTTLPRAMSARSVIADYRHRQPGALVPKATTVSPTTSGEMPKDSEKPTPADQQLGTADQVTRPRTKKKYP